MVWGWGFRVQNSGCRMSGFWFFVEWFMVHGLLFRAWGLGLKVKGLGSQVWGLGLREGPWTSGLGQEDRCRGQEEVWGSAPGLKFEGVVMDKRQCRGLGEETAPEPRANNTKRLKDFPWKLRPESGLYCLSCAIFVRQLFEVAGSRGRESEKLQSSGLSPESRGPNLALTVLQVLKSLDSGVGFIIQYHINIHI